MQCMSIQTFGYCDFFSNPEILFEDRILDKDHHFIAFLLVNHKFGAVFLFRPKRIRGKQNRDTQLS
jgi:hypothetical protein